MSTGNRGTLWPCVIQLTKEELYFLREIGKEMCLLSYGFYVVEDEGIMVDDEKGDREPGFFTIRQLAWWWGVSPDTVRREIDRGHLTATLFGRTCVRVSRAEAERYIRENKK